MNASLLTGLGLAANVSAIGTEGNPVNGYRSTFSMDQNQVSLYASVRVTSTKVFHITDSHLSLDDERGAPYREFSARMAAAYTSNSHFETGETCSAEESFERTLDRAKKEDASFLALTGDIFSFPSEAAVEWAREKLDATGIPFAYVAGNHDWHYEGMKGSSRELRDTWAAERLSPMYQGNTPLYATYEYNGIRFVCIDNSTYEILPEQLGFFTAQTNSALPMVLLLHIPLYMTGRSMGFGCGHPEWGGQSDRNYEIERREKWPEGGHTQVTLEFCRAVFDAPNLLAVLAGHTHRQSLDIKNGIPQLVSRENASGFYLEVNIQTAAE
ncbi:MAG: Calcineurin-like phosphoesterase [Candidatus Hydrogenedentes bacterium ADurb.Bin179]|nr:MAG: Calcineurin-like phosphoesterase [Candidatus Hydrogenedentes bacterium ADurb.Bin179]